jgi:outer membrane protein OmpA-like peptidoglycan-associated protein
MNRTLVVSTLLPLALAFVSACASQPMPPKALSDARDDFVRAHDGIASQLDPTDVHEADLALQRAEQAYRQSPDSPSTVDLAIIADRKALIAEAEARAIKAQQDTARSTAELQALKAAQLQNAQNSLNQTQQALGQTQMQLQEQQANSAMQQQKLQEMEAKLKDARNTIAKIASVKDDDRGMVITLQGEVLFPTAKYDLKPGAMAKLDQIAEALKGKEQPIVVYGYTDNVGTRDHNMGLSQLRAQAVRDYLVSKGIPQDLITAQGKGPDEPIADNTSIDGRAQNRRVEIVVQPKK